MKVDDIVQNPPEIAQRIYELRAQNKSYKEIAEELGCAKSTVSYGCSSSTRTKVKERTDKVEKGLLRLRKNLTGFKRSKPSSNIQPRTITGEQKLVKACSDFFRRCNMKNGGYKEILDKFGTNVKCYLTGRDIDLTKDEYNLDHIVPVSKGGEGTIENLGFTIPQANRSKSDMTLEEYLDLCEEVLRYHGRIK